MNPCILLRPPLTLVGLACNGSQHGRLRDRLWAQIANRHSEILHADPDAGYGLHMFDNGNHRYLAGLAVNGPVVLPEGMTSFSLPQHAYAVFHHFGLLSTLDQTLLQIFDHWLPGSGYQQAADTYYEYYDDRFSPGSPDSLMFVNIPVVTGE